MMYPCRKKMKDPTILVLVTISLSWRDIIVDVKAVIKLSIEDQLEKICSRI